MQRHVQVLLDSSVHLGGSGGVTGEEDVEQVAMPPGLDVLLRHLGFSNFDVTNKGKGCFSTYSRKLKYLLILHKETREEAAWKGYGLHHRPRQQPPETTDGLTVEGALNMLQAASEARRGAVGGGYVVHLGDRVQPWLASRREVSCWILAGEEQMQNHGRLLRTGQEGHDSYCTLEANRVNGEAMEPIAAGVSLCCSGGEVDCVGRLYWEQW